MTDRIKGILLLGAAALWWRIKHNLNNIAVNVENVSFKKIEGQNAIFEIDILVKNPLLIDIDVQEITGSLYIYDVYLATIQTAIKQIIKANSYSHLSVGMSVDISQVSGVLKESFLKGSSDVVQGVFDGRLIIENITIPIKEGFSTQIAL